MAIRSTAGDVFFYLFNINRTHANPPIVFPDFKSENEFGFSIWVKVTEAIPNNLWTYQGTDGSYIALVHDGFTWRLQNRNVATVTYATVGPVDLNKWTLFHITKFISPLNTIRVWRGTEPDPGPPGFVTLNGPPVATVDFGSIFTFNFDRMTLTASAGMSICNFKFWKGTANNINETQSQANTWNPATFTVGANPPMWCSTLRTPGDLSNIANPMASFWWTENYEYTLIQHPEALVYTADPRWLNTERCSTWIYPIGAPVITYNPGLTPAVPTTYKALKFVTFEDRGSVPTTPFEGIAYLGVPSNYPAQEPGQPPSDTYGLFHDEDNNEVPIVLGPNYRFETDTISEVPAPINSINMYLWFFGAQFTWQPNTPQVTTTTGYLSIFHLFVTYIGTPTGIPSLPPDLVGLFAINKGGKSVDRYNRGVELKIPNPTVRTAFIGE